MYAHQAENICIADNDGEIYGIYCLVWGGPLWAVKNMSNTGYTIRTTTSVIVLSKFSEWRKLQKSDE